MTEVLLLWMNVYAQLSGKSGPLWSIRRKMRWTICLLPTFVRPQCLGTASCPFLLIASLYLHTDKLDLGDGTLRSFEPISRAEGEREEPASKCDNGDATNDYRRVVECLLSRCLYQ